MIDGLAAIPPITVDLPLDLIATTGWISYPTRLTYNPDTDPVAVSLTFLNPDPDEQVTWRFARDLLRAGLYAPTGVGDVRVWPAQHTPGSLFLHLHATAGDALFEMSWDVIAEFTDTTYRLVPRGAEGMHLHLDAELRALGDPTP